MNKSELDDLIRLCTPDDAVFLDALKGLEQIFDFLTPKTKAGKAQAAKDATRYLPKSMRPMCGARTRAGGNCQAKVVPGATRCRMHGAGGRTEDYHGGPKTQAGRTAIAEANRRRAAQRRAT